MWPGGVMVNALACDLRGREFNSRPSRCQVTTLGKLFTRASVTKQYNLVPVAGQRCPATGVTVAMRHRLKWFIHLRVQGLNKGDAHPTNSLHRVWYSLLYLHLAPPLGITPFGLCWDCRHQKKRVPGLSWGTVCMILCLAVSVEHRLVTDRRTDRHTMTANTHVN